MATFIQFANDLAKYFVRTRNKKQAATHIIYEINSHIDPESKQLPSDADKILVVQFIEEFISGKLRFQLKKGEMIATKAKDYDLFLEMKEYILRQIVRRKSKNKNH